MNDMPRTTRWQRVVRLVAAAAALLVVWAAAAADADDRRVLPSARSRDRPPAAERPPEVPDDATLEAAGAVIGEIRLNRLNVFDTAVPEEDTVVFRTANRLRIVTRESTIGSQLLFQSGDRYDARLLRESERLLRTRTYLREARIVPVAVHDNVVDVEITTQDTWTLEPQIWFSRKGGTNTGGIGIEESNLLGFGSELGLSFRDDIDRDSKVLRYRDPHLLGSRWRLDTAYADSSDGNTKQLEVERPFYSLDARWAGGAAWREERRIDSVYDNGNVVARFGTHERVGTVYGGWSEGLRDGNATRWTFGVTHDERRASPVDPPGPLPGDQKLVYPWIGIEWIEDDFRATRNLNQIGRTEDLAFGWQVQLRLGRALRGLGSDRTATVFEGTVSKALTDGDAHTLLLGASAKGRVESGTPIDTLVGVTVQHHWRQSARRVLFTGVQADQGKNLDLDQQLTLGGDNGLRGYPQRYRSGQGRWLFTLEQRWYTDWFPFRLFNVGAAVFYDMGATTGDSVVAGAPPPLPGQSGTLRDVGFGLRLGNNRLSFGNVVHIDVAFPLDGDASIDKFQINIQGKKSF
jgi:outer membrane protein assembly factor BamA